MPVRPEASAFQSCPAATGELRCNHFPDKAHRCKLNRGPDPSDHHHIIHICTCTFPWTAVLTQEDPPRRCNGCHRAETEGAMGRLMLVVIEVDAAEEGGGIDQLLLCDDCLVSAAPHLEAAGSTAYLVTGAPKEHKETAQEYAARQEALIRAGRAGDPEIG